MADTSRTTTSDFDTQLRCNTCGQRFSRLEHLKRHGQVHASHKPYRCVHCDRTFARKDALKRHEYTHQPLKSSPRSTALRHSCSTCAEARVKCSGDKPCARCTSRNIHCQYSPRKLRRPTPVITGCPPPPAIPEQGISDPSNSNYNNDGIAALVAVGNDQAPPFETYVGEHENNISCFDALPSVEGVQETPFDSSRRATNWLPFEHSSQYSHASFLISDQGPCSPNFEQPVWTSAQEDISDYEQPSRAGRRSASFRHDRISALITSMGKGLHRTPENSRDDKPTEHEKVHFASRYADGAGARSSQSNLCMAEKQRIHSVVGAAAAASGDADASWIETLQNKIRSTGEDGKIKFLMPALVYQEILVRINAHRNKTVSLDFPEMENFTKDTSLEMFIRLYFEKFHPVYSFLDPSLLSIPVWGWALCLATAALGARLLAVPAITAFSDHLCMILDEILVNEIDFRLTEDSLPYVQARALTSIAMCLSQDNSVMNRGYNAATLMLNACLRLRLLDEDDCIGAYTPDQELEQVWIAWRFRETRRRTGLFIWVTDCVLAFMFQTSPRLPLRCLNLKLPSEDNIWEADTSEKWLKLLERRNSPSGHFPNFLVEEKLRSSVRDAFQALWSKGQAPKPTTQLGSITIISMLVSRSWDTAWYLNDSDIHAPKQYLAAIPKFASWRNITCDCLDILHWKALSVSARGGGIEGPVFLHLHLARLTLLTPVRDFFDYAHDKGAHSASFLLPHDLYSFRESELRNQSKKTIRIWVHDDRYKARLSVIHAGAIFWHVRRYSSNSFVEPFAVFLATLTLWMYGRHFNDNPNPPISPSIPSSLMEGEGNYLSEVVDAPSATTTSLEISSQSRHDLGGSSSCGQDDDNHRIPCQKKPILPPQYQRMPKALVLDRPIDDELVQYFIRSDTKLVLSLEGVSDLYSTEGHDQVLREGISLLDDSAACWPVARNYSVFLCSLIDDEINS